jgi:NAD(P)-dependent dehydrogenase (short-subunit alcohol dehydrogenase family)
MDLMLAGKKALVTGSTAGIGFAIARSLGAEGAEVFINGRTRKRVDEAVLKIQSDFSDLRVTGIEADLSNAAGIATLISRLPDVDILVNNLGIFDFKPFEEIPDEEWFRYFETNVMSGVRLSRQYLPKMLEKNWGRILFISSDAGVSTPVEMIHYGMSKSAQISIARGLAERTAESNVTVNSILPGATSSEGVKMLMEQLAAKEGISLQEMEEKFFREARPSSLLKRFITPKEIADFVAFVCSPLAAAINGASLRVEGGVVPTMI